MLTAPDRVCLPGLLGELPLRPQCSHKWTHSLLHSEGAHQKSTSQARWPFRDAQVRDPRSEEPVATCDMATLSQQCHQSGVTGLVTLLGLISTPSFTHTQACTHTYARAHLDHPEICVGLCCKKPLCSWRGTPRLRDIQRLGQGIRLVSHRSGNPTPFLLCHRNTSLTRHF